MIELHKNIHWRIQGHQGQMLPPHTHTQRSNFTEKTAFLAKKETKQFLSEQNVFKIAQQWIRKRNLMFFYNLW